MNFADDITGWIREIIHDAWIWFARLNQEEWIALLMVVACLGFVCMRGLTSKGQM